MSWIKHVTEREFNLSDNLEYEVALTYQDMENVNDHFFNAKRQVIR